MAAETEPTDGITGDDEPTETTKDDQKPKGNGRRRREHGVQSTPGKPLRTPPVNIDRRVGPRDYEFIGSLQHVPDKTEMSQRFGAGVYRLTCQGKGRQIWTIGELEVPPPGNEPAPVPETPVPKPPEAVAHPTGGDTNVQILLRVAALEQLARYQADANRAAEDKARRAFERIEAAIDSLAAFVAELAEFDPPEPEPPKNLLQQLQEMAAMKQAFQEIEGLFGEGPDTSSPWAMVAPELAAGLRDFRQQMSPGQPGSVPGASFPNQPQGPPHQPAPRWPPPGQGPPPIPGLTPEKEEAIKRGIAENGFTWEQARLYAAAHDLDADKMLAILAGEMAPPA